MNTESNCWTITINAEKWQKGLYDSPRLILQESHKRRGDRHWKKGAM